MVLLAPGYSLSRQRTQRGFTIVELLIVVVVIAILAGITIVAFSGIRGRAIDTSLQSDLRNSQTAIRTAEIDGDIPTDTSSFKASNGATYQYTYDNTGSPKTYCITATISSKSFYINHTGSPTAGACPGHFNGGVAPTVTWANTTLASGQWQSAAVSDDGQKIMAVTYNSGAISGSQDGGATWSTNGSSSGTTTWYSIAGTPNGSVYYALRQNGAIMKSTNDGVTWTQASASTGTGAFANSIGASSDGTTVAVYRSNGISVSTNSGSTWALVGALPGGTATDMTLSDNGNYLYVISSNGSVYKNVYNGSAWGGWTDLPNMAVQATTSNSMIDTSADGSKVYAVTTSLFKASSDYGATGTTKTWPTNFVKGDIKASADGTRLIGRDSSGFIYLSFDNADTWIQQNTALMVNTAWGAINTSTNGTYFIAGRTNGTILKGTF